MNSHQSRSFLAAHSAALLFAVTGLFSSTETVAGPPTRPAQGDGRDDDGAAMASFAMDQYKSQDFESAARTYLKIYAKTHAEAAVYNAARAWEAAGKPGSAVGLYRLFISISADADRIAAARDRIVRLERDPGTAAAAAPGAQPPEQAQGSRPPLNATSRHSGSVPEAHPPIAATSATSIRWPIYFEAGGAIALIATGSALLYLGQRDSSTAGSMTIATDADIIRYHDRYASARLEWWSGAASAAAGVGLGAWAIWSTLRTSRGRVTFTPAPSGAVVTARF